MYKKFLYNDDLGYHFMHTETFEQVAFQKDLINAPDLLKEGQNVVQIVGTDLESTIYFTAQGDFELVE